MALKLPVRHAVLTHQPKIPILIIGGVMNPQSERAKCRKNKRLELGSHLDGVKADMHNVEKYLQESETFEVYNIVRNSKRLTVQTVIKEITALLDENMKFVVERERRIDGGEKVSLNSQIVGIYYSGHGCEDGGDWCFADGVLGFPELFDVIKLRGNIKIFSDSCFSGDWAEDLADLEGLTRNVQIIAGSMPGRSALDDGDKGGMATKKWLDLFPKLFDSKGSIEDMEKAMEDSYGCIASIDNKGVYHYRELRDAEGELQLYSEDYIIQALPVNSELERWMRKHEVYQPMLFELLSLEMSHTQSKWVTEVSRKRMHNVLGRWRAEILPKLDFENQKQADRLIIRFEKLWWKNGELSREIRRIQRSATKKLWKIQGVSNAKQYKSQQQAQRQKIKESTERRELQTSALLGR